MFLGALGFTIIFSILRPTMQRLTESSSSSKNINNGGLKDSKSVIKKIFRHPWTVLII